MKLSTIVGGLLESWLMSCLYLLFMAPYPPLTRNSINNLLNGTQAHITVIKDEVFLQSHKDKAQNLMFQGLCSKEVSPNKKACSRSSYRICKAWCKMKMQGSLFKNYQEFQESNSRALSQVWQPSQSGALCKCWGYKPGSQI